MKINLFKRLFFIITIIIILAGIISIFLGQYTVRQYFLKMKIGELEPKTKFFASQLGIGGTLPNEIDAKSLMIDGIAKIYDRQKNQIVKFVIPDKIILKDELFIGAEFDLGLEPYINNVLLGKSIKLITELKGLKGTFIIIGEPIVNQGNVIAAFFSIKPVDEFNASIHGFYLALIFSMIIAFVLIIVSIYFFAKKLLEPLDSMRNASIAMSNGDFSVRAVEGYKDEIGELATSLNFLASCLEKNENGAKLLEQTRRDYVANVSHELRTPIASIRAIAETLSDDMLKDNSEKNKYYGMLLRESIRLDNLIRDMLELSRLQSSNVALEKKIIDTGSILKNVIMQFEIIADDMDISFICENHLSIIPKAYSNADRIMQVLIILLDNAIKYTPSGGKVTLSISWDSDIIKVSVKDTGIGIDKCDLPFVFERFYKSDKAHSSRGTGLGLSIAREILYSLDEDIFVESNLGEGSNFTFSIHRK